MIRERLRIGSSKTSLTPSSTVSAIAPLFVVTTGSPAASASRTTRGCPSGSRGGNSNTDELASNRDLVVARQLVTKVDPVGVSDAKPFDILPQDVVLPRTSEYEP